MDDDKPDIKDIALKHPPLSRRTLRFGCAAVILASGLLSYSCLPHPPSDAKVLENFHINRTHFESLVRMLEEDHKVGTVTDRFLFERNHNFIDVEVEQLGITEDRLEKYLTHMDSANIRRLDTWSLDNHGEKFEVHFGYWGWGGIDVWWHKDIVWSPVEPVPGAGFIHRPIDGNWYLYSDVPGEDGVTPVEQL